MTENIDELFTRIETEQGVLGLAPKDIDALVAHYRRQRTAGPRPKKETGPKAQIDLAALGLVSKPAEGFVRRKL